MLESKLYRVALALFVLISIACGKSPTTPPTPTPPPVPTYSVSVIVFNDDNEDGVQNGNEPAIVPFAEVEIGGRTGTTGEGTGGSTITGITAGTYPVSFRKLPPFYQAGAVKTITVPQTGGTLLVPAVQSTADNVLGLILVSGDSIGQGDPGSADRKGFRTPLEAKVRAGFLRASMQYRGGGGLASDVAKGRTQRDLRLIHPSYVTINWGTNDWNPQPFEDCQGDPASPNCRLIDNLHSMIETIQGSFAFPCLSTLPPVNTALQPPQRNEWIRKANDLLRTLAKQDGALLVDVHDAFVKSGKGDALLFDEIHPNDAGYALIAETYYKALTQGTITATSYAPPVLFPLSSERASASLTRRRR